MEPTKQILNHIFCPIHEDIIRKVGISDNNDLSLLCIECEQGQKLQTFSLENFLKYLAHNPSLIPKLQQLSSITN